MMIQRTEGTKNLNPMVGGTEIFRVAVQQESLIGFKRNHYMKGG
jgi:hypothetical protein